MKEPQFTPAFLRPFVQFPVRFVQLPRAGQHSTIFVGVGIAQHHFLPVSPGIEVRVDTRDAATDAALHRQPRAAI